MGEGGGQATAPGLCDPPQLLRAGLSELDPQLDHAVAHPADGGGAEAAGEPAHRHIPGQHVHLERAQPELRRGGPSNVSEALVGPARLTRDELRERMSGNLCRCGAHNGIVDAILDVYGDAEAAA